MKKAVLLSSLLFICLPGFANTVEDNSTAASANSTAHTHIVASTPAEDAAITTTLTKLIKNSKTLSSLPVTFTVNKGTVTFNGTVDSDSEAAMLVETASSIVGVGDVKVDDLKVPDSKQPFSDMLITAKVKGLLIREDLLGDKDLSSLKTGIETQNGIVYITGTVDNKQQIDNAVNIILIDVPEVKKVKYNVRYELPDNADQSDNSKASSALN